MKKIISLLMMAGLISIARAGPPPDAQIVFSATGLDYVVPQIAIKSRGQLFTWVLPKEKNVEICIKEGYYIPFEAQYMNPKKPRCLPVSNNAHVIKAKIRADFSGITIPAGGFVEVGYSVISGDQEIDPLLRIY